MMSKLDRTKETFSQGRYQTHSSLDIGSNNKQLKNNNIFIN